MIRLEQLDGMLRFSLAPGRSLVLGRAAGCDLVVPDPAVSRRHATVEADGDGLTIRDLGSVNGTRVNGRAIQEARAGPNDDVTFGATTFRVTLPSSAALADSADLPPGSMRSLVDVLPTIGRDRRVRVLDRLLEVAAGLSGDVALERLLDTIAELTLEHVDADRVALFLSTPPTGALEPAAARSRTGEAAPVVPRAIAERAIQDRAPVITESAEQDERLASGSVRMQRVRSAICAPLLAGSQTSAGEQSTIVTRQSSMVLGALYADTITRPTPFSEDEAAALMAFAGLAAVAIARARFAQEAARERELRRSFERFFAPSVAETIVAGNAGDVLTGSRREAAVLFSDIRGFTALTEHMSPEETARLLADYLGVAVDVIFEHGGTLDKFVGDAVMAVWGVPLPRADAADRALAAALAIGAELAGLNARRRQEGRPEITAGVGISYGPVFAGNVGSDRRLEYTVVGDPVNVASRLCAAAAPGEILLTEDVVTRLAAPGQLERVGESEVRGRTGKLVVYRVIAT